jgi:hypothetical protein
MEVSTAAREVSDMMIFSLIKEETKLYTKIDYFMDLKVKAGQRLFSMGANEANVKKCLTQCQTLDDAMEPIMREHQQVVSKLKAYGVVVNHNF